MPDPQHRRRPDLIEWLAAFGRTLRAAGIEIDTVRLQNALAALDAIDLRSEHEGYWALRCTLLSCHEHIALFDAVLAGVLELPFGSPERRATGAGPGSGQAPHSETPGLEQPLDGSAESNDCDEVGLRASAEERLRELDLSSYEAQDVREARRLIEQMTWSLPRRTSRRLKAASNGKRLDFRRTTQSAIRTGGHPLARAWRSNSQVDRRIVLLLDISGSMAGHSRPLMMFAQTAVRASSRLEVFTFGTRLTRVTDELDQWDPAHALASANQSVPDWSGGTRIGESLRVFNEGWGRRGISRGAVVVIVSDGWERGDPRLLETEMENLARSAHNIVWVNPLAGDPEYEPLAAGMAAALLSVDVFLPGHNLSALGQLVGVLETLTSRRRGPTTRRLPAG